MRMAHLVGSIPLESAESAMQAAAGKLGAYLERIPDGETGQRRKWLGWQREYIVQCPALAASSTQDQYSQVGRSRLRPGWTKDELRFDTLGYAEPAMQSFQTFSAMRARGIIPEHMRFQVSLPTPLAITAAYMDPDSQQDVEPAIENGLLRDINRILSTIDHNRLALQWDVAIEFAIMYAGFPVWFAKDETEILARLNRLTSLLPLNVSLGYHLCFGDSGHKHFAEPASLAPLVSIANGIAKASARPVNWFHMPVPRDRNDASYFEPLQDYAADADLYLGLIHMTDGYDGAARRISRARQYRDDFGVATECGFGRRPPGTIEPLLDLHHRVCSNL